MDASGESNVKGDENGDVDEMKSSVAEEFKLAFVDFNGDFSGDLYSFGSTLFDNDCTNVYLILNKVWILLLLLLVLYGSTNLVHVFQEGLSFD
jgi:hypothetical protein